MDIEITEWSSDYDRPYTLDELDTAEIPVCHTATVTERRIVVDDKTLIQNNVRTDTLALVLDGEWDGANVVILIGKTGSEVELEWKGEPVVIPSQVAENVGSIDLSVVGYSSDGTVRLVTAEASGAMTVIRSGALTGDVPAEDAQDVLAQLLESATQARDAAASATTASASATSAAQSATSAASQAISAAASATTATAKATEAASAANEAANTASSIIAQLPLPDGNVLRGTRRGEVVSVDDAYAAVPLGLKVYGKTRQNLWVNPSGTSDGITATSNDDGSVTISGTCSGASAYVSLHTFILKPSTQYTLSVDKTVEGATSDPNANAGFYVQTNVPKPVGVNRLSVTFTTDATLQSDIRFGFACSVGNTVSGTYKVMLNEGSTAEPWCPPGIHGVGELMAHERNLWVNPSEGKIGVSTTVNSDGSFTLSGTTTVASVAAITYGVSLKPSTTYTATIDKAISVSSGNATAQIAEIDSGGQQVAYHSITTAGVTFTTSASLASANTLVYVNASGATVSGTYRVMLNEGDTASPWVPPQVESCVLIATGDTGDEYDTLTPVDLNGEVLYDLPDGTADELVIDGAGAASVDSELYLFEPESCHYVTEIAGGIRARIDMVTMPGIPSSTALLSSHFYWDYNWIKIGGFTCNNSSGQLFFQLPTSEVTSLDKQGVDEWIAKNRPKFLMYRPTPTTTPLDSVPLPALPSPNATVWDAGTHPGEVEMEYVRDVNVVIGKLEGAM